MKFEELILDDGFISFVEGNNDQSGEKWEKLAEEDPEFRQEMELAREIISALKNLHRSKVPFDKQAENDYLLREIDLREKHSGHRLRRQISVIKVVAIAASLLLIMSLSVLSYYYFSIRQHKVDGHAFHQVIAPKGEKAEVILSDGSKVWLNSESKLRYPEGFTKGKRKVYLDGEAYFDVEKVKNSTFTVNVNDANITVLGTEFNIKNYQEDDDLEVTVVKGSVLVADNKDKMSYKPLILKPFEKVSISKSNHNIHLESTKNLSEPDVKPDTENQAERKITIKHVDPQADVSWKDQKLIFDNETLSEMAVMMGRWYNIPVHVEDSLLGTQRYTGKFVNNENIYQVLSAIELTTPVDYDVRNNEIFIKQKPKTKP